MFIAQKLRKENIVEYLLYMWQIEDLLRALSLDMDKVATSIITPYQLDNQKKKEIFDWYESLIEMMRQENAQTLGHLQINRNIIIELDDFHAVLLQSGKKPEYNAKFFYVLPYINILRAKTDNNSALSNIEICFNFLYGIMLLKIKKTDISSETTQIQTEISKFLVLLAQNFKHYKSGELELN